MSTDYRAALFNMAFNHRMNPYANSLDGTARILDGAAQRIAELEAALDRIRRIHPDLGKSAADCFFEAVAVADAALTGKS